MKVWLVWEHSIEGDYLLGVFDCEEKAKSRLKTIMKKVKDIREGDYSIQEKTVD